MSNESLNLTPDLYTYLLNNSLRETELQKKLREHTQNIELSQMQIAPEQGQFMALLVKLLKAKKAIEVGVYTGYSSLAVAQAMPEDGHIIACDINKEWTDIARDYWKQARIDHKISLHLAPAVKTLTDLINDNQSNTFDFAFIDANKTSYEQYFELCLKLLRTGGLLLIDNTLWGGSVADNKINDDDTIAIRELNKKLRLDKRIELSMLPVADGLTLCLKR